MAVFDILRAEAGSPFFFEQPSLLPLEESILHRVTQGQLALDDLLGLEDDQLQRTYHLLANNDFALSDASARLEGKLAELEAANRVLIQRTELMISLQEIAQVLITSGDLNDLAARGCRRAGELCNADRTILYYLHSEGGSKDQMEVLAVNGWEPALLDPLKTRQGFEVSVKSRRNSKDTAGKSKRTSGIIDWNGPEKEGSPPRDWGGWGKFPEPSISD